MRMTPRRNGKNVNDGNDDGGNVECLNSVNDDTLLRTETERVISKSHTKHLNQTPLLPLSLADSLIKGKEHKTERKTPCEEI